MDCGSTEMTRLVLYFQASYLSQRISKESRSPRPFNLTTSPAHVRVESDHPCRRGHHTAVDRVANVHVWCECNIESVLAHRQSSRTEEANCSVSRASWKSTRPEFVPLSLTPLLGDHELSLVDQNDLLRHHLRVRAAANAQHVNKKEQRELRSDRRRATLHERDSCGNVILGVGQQEATLPPSWPQSSGAATKRTMKTRPS